MKHNRILLLVAWFLLAGAGAQAQITPAQYRQAVLEHSYRLRAARMQTQAALRNAEAVRTGFLPQLSADGDFSVTLPRQRGTYRGAPAWIEPYTFSLQPTVVQTIYAGGAVRTAYGQARIEAGMARLDEAFTGLEVSYAAEYAYWNLAANESYYRVAREYVNLIESLKKVIDLRFEDGYIGKGDVLQIAARLSEAQYGVVNAEKYYKTALHNFNVLRGTAPEQPVVLKADMMQQGLPPQRIPLEEILLHRPDYIRSQLSIEHAKLQVERVKAPFNPSVSVGLSGVWHNTNPNFNWTNTVDGVGVVRLSVPIFHWGERRHAVASAQALVQAGEYEQGDLFDRIVQDEYNAWTGILESRMQMDASRESLDIGRQNLDLSTYSYNEGQVTILEVLSAQLSWLQLYTNAITASYNYRVSISQYHYTAGMGE